MKAIVQSKYGNANELQIADVPKPIVKKDTILIKMKAVNVASGDMRINTLSVPGLLKPIMRLIFGWKGPRKKIRGISGAGLVVETGDDVANFKKGDKVYFINSMGAGALAEYIALKEKSMIAHLPKNMSFEEAAPLAFGAMSAIHFINEKNVQNNDKALIYGASGSVGTYALQLAKYFGAEVTAVCSKKNHQVVKSIGADHIIDYQTTDISLIKTKYDVVLDAVSKLKKKEVKHLLKKNSRYLSLKMPTAEKQSRLKTINRIVEEDKLKTVIDHTFSFEDYKEAHELAYSGHKTGNVVIKVDLK
jgi:NADPH:quinone reductase-like Zn-dependent oxidoreductase